MPEGGEEKGFAETAGAEQDVVFSLVFEGFYKGCFVNVEVPLCDKGLEVADSVRGFHVFNDEWVGQFDVFQLNFLIESTLLLDPTYMAAGHRKGLHSIRSY